MLPILAVYTLASIATFLAFAVDKHAARAGRRRIPEGSLHLLEFLGGWIGALIATQVLRHKSSKPRYYLMTWGIALLHGAAWLSWFILA